MPFGKNKKIIAFTSGGTAGHVFPAEGLCETFQQRGYETIFFTDKRGARFLQKEAIIIRSGTPWGGKFTRVFMAMVALTVGFIQAFFHLVRKRPAAVVGFGGYASFPVLMAAIILRIPIYLQEQNTVLGRVNKFFLPMARLLFTTCQKLKNLPSKHAHKVVSAGMPLRASFQPKGQAFVPPQPQERFHLLVFGGSQGSQFMTNVVSQGLALLAPEERARLVLVQQCQAADMPKLSTFYEEQGIECSLSPFFKNMDEHMNWAHLIISRSGAMSVHEVSLVKRPALFVPLASAIDNDQLENARRLADAGAAFLCVETDFSPAYLQAFLRRCMSNVQTLEQVATAIIQWKKEGDCSKTKIADCIERQILAP